jgi:hypothetical protein
MLESTSWGFDNLADMKQQLSFAQAEYARKKKVTRRERFLGEMEKVVPWARLGALIEPHYPQRKRGRPPIGIERMLRIYFLQQWYALAEDALYRADDRFSECRMQGVASSEVQSVATNYRLPNGSTPAMPPNGPSDWQWNVVNYSATSAFFAAASAAPDSSLQNRLSNISSLLRQVKRGDCFQCVWREGTGVILHTLLFTRDYQQGQDFEWVAATETKLNGIPAITSGNYFGWGEEKTWGAVLDRLTRYSSCGATLYRLRRDITKR